MKMKFYLFLLFTALLHPIVSNAQNCTCPRTHFVECVTPYHTFKFSSGRSLAISSSPDTLLGKQLFSEFVIYECGQDTIIKFYSAVENCIVSFSDDTLFIGLQEPLAIGPGHTFVDTTWLTEKYYYIGNQLHSHSVVTPYFDCTSKGVKTLLGEYHAIEWNTQLKIHNEKEHEKMMNMASRLMLVSVCADSNLERYFKEFKEKYKPDGANAEWYNKMDEMIQTAKRLRPQ